MGDRQSAVNFFNQAVQALNQHDNSERLKHSYQLFSSACYADPTWGQAFYQHANNNSDLDKLLAAIAGWRRALQCEMAPLERARALSNLGWRLHCLGQTEEAMQHIQESLQLDPNGALTWVNLSCIQQVMGAGEASLQAAEMAYALNPTDPTVELAYAFGNLYAGHIAKGLKHFECRFAYQLKSYLQFPYPKWTGEADATLYLDADQGLGDTLSFARFVPASAKRCKHIHACVQPELARLFLHAFNDLPNVSVVPKPCGFLPADYWSTFVSLPFALGLSEEEIRSAPAIKPPSVSMPVRWKVANRKLHVGISWAGSTLNRINAHRCIPVEQFFDLYRVEGIQLYALQIDQNRQQLYDAGGMGLIYDLSPSVQTVLDTIALVQDLDLVITCESALGHICGLINKECWIPYAKLGKDYRIGLRGENCFWYPNHRIFNQERAGQWQPVFDEIVQALRERIDGHPG